MTDTFDTDTLQRYLGDRVTREHIQRRQEKELRKATLRRQEMLSWKTKLRSKRWYLHQALRLSQMHRLGKKNALNITTNHNTLNLPTLPKALDGFTILHISDLHIDMLSGVGERLIDLVTPIDAGLTLITGDFRDRSYGPPGDSLSLLKPVAAAIQGPCYGVLGNHDSLGLVPGLEAMGISVLLNEAVSLDVAGETIEIVGIDDPSYFKCDDLDRATANLDNTESLRILMAHAPNRIPQAADANVDLYLCGHTHGGQICLPGNRPLVSSVGNVEWQYCSGNWEYSRMIGYTSRGAGTSVVPARFNCPPEITVHTLRRG